MTTPAGTRPVWVEVDRGAIRANVAALREHVQGAPVMAVVKADGYGHGAVPAAQAALDGGASWLAVAVAEEGAELRAAGIDAPVLVLSEPTWDSAHAVVANRLIPVVYTVAGVEAVAKAVAETGSAPVPVHLKVDTGMHRVGCEPSFAPELASVIVSHHELRFDGLCTHFATADEPDNPYLDRQLVHFGDVIDAMARNGLRPRVVHAANSAAAMTRPDAWFDLVRTGIALYGIKPAPAFPVRVPLAPALSLHARVVHTKDLPAGASVSYGLRYRLERAGRVAVVPIGYADGVPRDLGLVGGEVLVRGTRRRIAGVVTMDQTIIDVGDAPVEVGDDVVLIGRQGDETITAEEWAARVGTIAYEIVCGIGPRVPRRYVG